jgi:hypothetical protein
MRLRDILAGVAVVVVTIKVAKHGTPLLVRFMGWVIR